MNSYTEILIDKIALAMSIQWIDSHGNTCYFVWTERDFSGEFVFWNGFRLT